jgi:hypothetical protein
LLSELRGDFHQASKDYDLEYRVYDTGGRADALRSWPQTVRESVFRDNYIVTGKGIVHQFTGQKESFRLFGRLAERACIYLGKTGWVNPEPAWMTIVVGYLKKEHPELVGKSELFGIPMEGLTVNAFDASAKAIDAASGGGTGDAKAVDVDDDATLSPKNLADKWGIPDKLNSLQSRLRRFRESNPAGNGTIWIEITDAKPREAKFWFRVRHVRPILDALKTTSERRAKIILPR